MSTIFTNNGRVTVVRPSYVKDFACDGQKCDAKCCRGWHILIDQPTVARWRKIKNKKLRREILAHFPLNAQGVHEVKMEQESCPMLGEDKLCFLQKTFGADYLSEVCRSYPRCLTLGGTFLMEGMSLTCPLVAKLALTRGPLHVVCESVPKGELQGIRCTDGRALPAGFAEDALRVCAALLEDTRRPLDARLALVGFYAETLEDLLAAGGTDALEAGEVFLHAPEVDALLSSLSFDAAGFLETMRPLVEIIEGIPEERKQELLGDGGGETYLAWRAAAEAQMFAPYGQLFSNALVNSLFNEGFPIGSLRSMLEDYRILVLKWKFTELFLLARTAGAEKIGGGDILSLVAEAEQYTLHRDSWNDVVVELVRGAASTPLAAWLPRLLDVKGEE